MANGNGNGGDGGAPTDQTFFRQYLQSQAPDGTTTVREIVSPTLLDADTAAAHEAAAGRTFTGFIDPSQMAGAQPAPPPAPTAPPLPSAVATPQQAVVPTGYAPTTLPAPDGGVAPPSALWKAVGPAGAVAGAMAAPWIAAPTGPFAPLVDVGVQGLGAGAGQFVQALGEGKPVSTALKEAAIQGAVGAGLGTAWKVAEPWLPTVARVVAGRMAPVLENVEAAAPILGAEGAPTVGEAAQTIGSLADDTANAARAGTQTAFETQQAIGGALPVSTTGMAPYAQAAHQALVQGGATPTQIAQFGEIPTSVIAPMMSPEPVPYSVLAGRERQVENWIQGAIAQGAPPETVTALTNLHNVVGTQLDAAAQSPAGLDIGLGPARSYYNTVRAPANETRFALANLQAAPPGAALADTVMANPDAFQQMVVQAAPADLPTLQQAWLSTARAQAAAATDPTKTLTAAYTALGPVTQKALFGGGREGLANVLASAGSEVLSKEQFLEGLAAGGGYLTSRPTLLTLAGVRSGLDVASPWFAGRALMSPATARFGAGLSAAAPLVVRGGVQGVGSGAADILENR